MKRRRFITLAAAFACAPAMSHAAEWRGRALGAELSVTLHGPRDVTRQALAAVPDMLDNIERTFSLYRPDSMLSVLNRTGQLRAPDRAMLSMMQAVERAHSLSGGIFDPTVQPLWRALAQGGNVDAARRAIGWDRVTYSEDGVVLAPGQALTFNGIAQGFATDAVRRLLAREGADTALINIGEHSALGGPFRLGLEDPHHGHLGTRTLQDNAIATSSPGALQLGRNNHILSPSGAAPLWSTVSIEASTATQADALSTAAVFMDRHALERLKQRAGLLRITTVDAEGNIATL